MEKERNERYERLVSYDCMPCGYNEHLDSYSFSEAVVNLLIDRIDQQDARIKELVEENQQLKFENGNLKVKISTQLQNNADNVDFMEDQKREIEQLKQSQNQKAIEVLTDILVNLCSKDSTIFGNHDEPIRVLDVEQISDFVNNQIKELEAQ